MQIINLPPKPGIEQDKSVQLAYSPFEILLLELRKRQLPDTLTLSINQHIEALNANSDTGTTWRKAVKKAQTSILKMLEKEIKVVPKNHYRKLWMVVGMSAFGLPLGVSFGKSMGNMGMLGLGLPIGMAIGLALGSGMDKKALAEGRQLDIDLEN